MTVCLWTYLRLCATTERPKGKRTERTSNVEKVCFYFVLFSLFLFLISTLDKSSRIRSVRTLQCPMLMPVVDAPMLMMMIMITTFIANAGITNDTVADDMMLQAILAFCLQHPAIQHHFGSYQYRFRCDVYSTHCVCLLSPHLFMLI